jgi:hypothetical protein
VTGYPIRRECVEKAVNLLLADVELPPVALVLPIKGESSLAILGEGKEFARPSDHYRLTRDQPID